MHYTRIRENKPMRAPHPGSDDAPLRVTHVVGGSLTGATSTVMQLVEHHHRERILPSLCFFSITGVDPSVAHRADELGVPWRSVKKSGRYDWFSLLRFAEALRDLAPEVVVLHGFGAYTFGAVATRLTRVPVRVRAEHASELYTPRHHAASFLTAPWVDSVILVSRYVGDYLASKHVRTPHPEVIYNGIEASRFVAVSRPPFAGGGIPTLLMAS